MNVKSAERQPFVNTVTNSETMALYRRQGLWSGVTLADRVGQVSRTHGTRLAVVDRRGSRTHSYDDLNRDALRLMRWMSESGLEASDVISIQLPNIYEAVVVAVAAQAVGAVINPLLPNYRSHELEHVFLTARPAAFFSPGVFRNWDYRQMIEEIKRTTGVKPIHVVVDELEDGGDVTLAAILDGKVDQVLRPIRSTVDARHVSEVIFTSGTEATPKAVMHTEETTNFAVATAFADLSVEESQVVWMPSPVGHSTGFNYGIRAALYHGRTLLLQDQWNPSDAVSMIKQYQGIFTLAATTFLQDLVEECERTSTRLDEMTHFGCGGAPVPAELVQRAEELGIVVLRLYGSTEALCCTWNRPSSPLQKRLTTDGPRLSHTDISVRDDDGVEIKGAGEGELHLRGPNVSVGYYDDPTRMQSTYLDDGWLRSGDLVEMDTDGYMKVVGRKKEIIIRGGLNIAPREIEDLLMTFPEIERAAVVGIANDRLGERSCACLVLREGQSFDMEKMTVRLRSAGLATYKLPEELRIVSVLPTTASGKVQKHEIVRQIMEETTSLVMGDTEVSS
jgi:acyl-CoA synthetase (AMP-forming)/AMP-acid ligase II